MPARRTGRTPSPIWRRRSTFRTIRHTRSRRRGIILTRHSLGAVLLEAGRPEQAEDVYRDDLKMWPENSWSLYGLMTALRIQGRIDEARLVEKRFIKAFVRADVLRRRIVCSFPFCWVSRA